MRSIEKAPVGGSGPQDARSSPVLTIHGDPPRQNTTPRALDGKFNCGAPRNPGGLLAQEHAPALRGISSSVAASGVRSMTLRKTRSIPSPRIFSHARARVKHVSGAELQGRWRYPGTLTPPSMRSCIGRQPVAVARPPRSAR